MDLSITTTSYGSDSQTWLGSEHGTSSGRPVTLDTSAFTSGTHYPDGYIKSGTPLAKITATGLYGPYTPGSDEIAKVTPATSGNTTVTFDGESTAALALTSPADAAGATALQTALEGLSNIDPGDVTVVDGGTTLDITFGGKYANKNVPNITVSGTGASVAVTAGGDVTSGLQDFAGFLFTPVTPGNPTTVDVQGVLLDHCIVIEANLPIAVDAVAKTAAAGRIIFR